MSLWGNSDSLTIPGAPTTVTIVGTATSEFWTAAGAGITAVPTGTTIGLTTAGEVGAAGFAVVEAVLGVDLVKINHLSSVPGTHDAFYTQQPISLKNDPLYAETSAAGQREYVARPVGVSTAEAEVTNGTVFETGVGWVGVQTYMDNSEQPPVMRVKKEILVAMSGIATGARPYPGTFGG